MLIAAHLSSEHRSLLICHHDTDRCWFVVRTPIAADLLSLSRLLPIVRTIRHQDADCCWFVVRMSIAADPLCRRWSLTIRYPIADCCWFVVRLSIAADCPDTDCWWSVIRTPTTADMSSGHRLLPIHFADTVCCQSLLPTPIAADPLSGRRQRRNYSTALTVDRDKWLVAFL